MNKFSKLAAKQLDSHKKKQTMNISFDFDGVLSNKEGRDLAEMLIDQGNEIYIITARQSSRPGDVFEIADELGIEMDHVIFTGGRDKWQFMDENEIAIHYDNNPEQIKKINEKTKTNGKIFIRGEIE